MATGELLVTVSNELGSRYAGIHRARGSIAFCCTYCAACLPAGSELQKSSLEGKTLPEGFQCEAAKRIFLKPSLERDDQIMPVIDVDGIKQIQVQTGLTYEEM